MLPAYPVKVAAPVKLSYGVMEAAAVLSISRGAIYKLLFDEKIHSFKIRGRRLIARTELEAFVARCMAESNGQPLAPPTIAVQKSEAALKGHAMRRALC